MAGSDDLRYFKVHRLGDCNLTFYNLNGSHELSQKEKSQSFHRGKKLKSNLGRGVGFSRVIGTLGLWRAFPTLTCSEL